MKNRLLKRSLGLGLGLALLVGGCAGRVSNYTDPQVKQLVAFVQDAAKAVHQQGETVFAEFDTPGSRWFKGDLYIVAYDDQGVRTAYGAHPERVGENGVGVNDLNGRPTASAFLTETSRPGKNSGWAFYRWAKAGQKTPLWKGTYVMRVKAPSGKEYVVGSGLYEMKLDRLIVQDLVDEAAALVQAKGTKAFKELRDKTGKYLFQDFYVFVDKPDGTELVNAAFPKIENTNIFDLKGSSGDLIVQRYIALALKKGSGWISYRWPRPGQTVDSNKLTYVKKVESGGQTYIVGSGLYL